MAYVDVMLELTLNQARIPAKLATQIAQLAAGHHQLTASAVHQTPIFSLTLPVTASSDTSAIQTAAPHAIIRATHAQASDRLNA